MNRSTLPTRPLPQSPGQQNLAIFKIYVAYRSLLSVVLLIMLVSPNTRQLVGTMNPTLYLTVALAYLATSAPLMGSLSTRLNQKLLFLVFLVDIAAITVLADCSGGMTSGLPILLVITAAASAVLLTNRTVATLIAALSVIALLVDTIRLILYDVVESNALFPAGLLGALIFAVSVMVQAIAGRLGKAEKLARDRASDLYNLQRLNEQIVQNMETGILLVDHDGLVRVMNKAATRLLAPERPVAAEQGHPLWEYSNELTQQFEHWRDSGQHRAKPFNAMDGGSPVIARFRELQPNSRGEALVFVEDYTPVTQYAQSLKLTSLGRLTASIAHEIRNPLGAISHAAQLLQESPNLSPTDRRMADIIQHHSIRVNQIVESVMQISRRKPPKPEYITLFDWLNEFVASYLKALNKPTDISIECDFRELIVEFDPENLQRVFANLLDNALRHSNMATGRERAKIIVSVDFATHQCLIDIIDSGTGVQPADQAQLFEPFFTTVEAGSGMGLYLCKELCEINNADLSYRPTAGGESCFRISLNQQAV